MEEAVDMAEAEAELVFARPSCWEPSEDEGRNGSRVGTGSGRTGPLQRTMSPSVKSVRMACWKSFLTAAGVGVGTWLMPEADVELGAAGALPLPLLDTDPVPLMTSSRPVGEIARRASSLSEACSFGDPSRG